MQTLHKEKIKGKRRDSSRNIKLNVICHDDVSLKVFFEINPPFSPFYMICAQRPEITIFLIGLNFIKI